MFKSLACLCVLSLLVAQSDVCTVFANQKQSNNPTQKRNKIKKRTKDTKNARKTNISNADKNDSKSSQKNGEGNDPRVSKADDKTLDATNESKENSTEEQTSTYIDDTIEEAPAILPMDKTPTVEAPAYNKLEPVVGWNRQSGDAARSVKQWFRWIKYLRMKEPVIMPWIDGLILRIYPKNEVFRALFVRGMYDPNLNVVIDALLPKNGVFVDAGANMGYFSLLAAKKVGSDGRILAIEPSSRDFIRLVDNVNINELHEVISCYKLAFSDSSGTADIMIANDERSGLNTLGSDFGTKGIEKVDVEKVEKITLDDFAEREGIKNIDVIKLDIEGSEFAALSGAKNTIQKFRPAIMLGINKGSMAACGVTFEQISQWLKDMNYVAYKLNQTYDNYSLEKVEDLSKAGVNVVFCLHNSVVPPQLPQPTKKSAWQCISDFFTK